MKKILLLFLVFPLCICNAQIVENTEPIMIPVDGYVITLQGDTIYGKVNVSAMANFVTGITFRPDEGEKTKYSAGEIKGFCQKRNVIVRILDQDITTFDQKWVHYESGNNPKNGKAVFLERLLTGKSIKVYNNPGGLKASTNVGDLKVADKEYSYILVKNGGPAFILKGKNFDEKYKEVFGDCDKFNELIKINPDKKKFKRLGFMVESYNFVCSQ
jgi:hypothetical protein